MALREFFWRMIPFQKITGNSWSEECSVELEEENENAKENSLGGCSIEEVPLGLLAIESESEVPLGEEGDEDTEEETRDEHVMEVLNDENMGDGIEGLLYVKLCQDYCMRDLPINIFMDEV